jgi:hypothetical protein
MCNSVAKVTRRVPHVEQELFTLPEHMNSHPDFSKVRVAWYLMFCVVFYWSLFVLFLFLLAIVLSVFLWITFTFGYCIVCISLNYFFFWPLYCLYFFELLFLLAIVLSVFLWITASYYSFGIFKLYLRQNIWFEYFIYMLYMA